MRYLALSKIKRIAKEFKQQNGNSNFTQKEMLIYLIDRVDKVYERLDSGSQKIAENRASIKMLKWALGGAIGLIGIVATLFGAIY